MNGEKKQNGNSMGKTSRMWKESMKQIEAVYGGETEGYHRFKVNGKDINLRIYIQKGKEIPEQVVIRLPKMENLKAAKGKSRTKVSSLVDGKDVTKPLLRSPSMGQGSFGLSRIFSS